MFFCQKLSTALLESAEGKEWPLKIFYGQSTQKSVVKPSGDLTCYLLITSGMCIRLSHWGKSNDMSHVMGKEPRSLARTYAVCLHKQLAKEKFQLSTRHMALLRGWACTLKGYFYWSPKRGSHYMTTESDIIWSTSCEKEPSNMCKMQRFRSSCTCAKYHSGLCSQIRTQWFR